MSVLLPVNQRGGSNRSRRLRRSDYQIQKHFGSGGCNDAAARLQQRVEVAVLAGHHRKPSVRFRPPPHTANQAHSAANTMPTIHSQRLIPITRPLRISVPTYEAGVVAKSPGAYPCKSRCDRSKGVQALQGFDTRRPGYFHMSQKTMIGSAPLTSGITIPGRWVVP